MYLALWCEANSWAENSARGLLGFLEEHPSRREHHLAMRLQGLRLGGKDRTANTLGGEGNFHRLPGWLGGQTAGRMGAGRGRPVCGCAAPSLGPKYSVSRLTPSSGKHPHPADAQRQHHRHACLGKKVYFKVGTVVCYKSHCESSTK